MPNPTDPVKEVTRGETTTTTSTRRGEIREGIPGTFTDTTKSTPVTTTTTGNGNGSVEFNAAFDSARKEGLPTFTFNNKEYTTEMKDSSTKNETSTTSTFERDKVVGVSKLQPHGIKFSPQSYKMGKTQNIQDPNTMGVYSVSRGNGRDASIRKLTTQEPMALNNEQGTSLLNASNRINKQLESRFGEKRIRAKFKGRSEEFINSQVAKGKTRIANNIVKIEKEK
jgi:hypothetical protein